MTTAGGPGTREWIVVVGTALVGLLLAALLAFAPRQADQVYPPVVGVDAAVPAAQG